MPELLLNEDTRWELTRTLFEENIFGIHQESEDFITVKSERSSPHYLNVRDAVTSHTLRNKIASSLISLTNAKSETSEVAGDYYVAGAPEAMTSFVTTIADLTTWDLLQPRANLQKTNGNKSPILGRYASGGHVFVYDDVITDGKTKIDTISQIESCGLEVANYFVVLDRQEGGVPLVEKETGHTIIPALAVAGMTRMLRGEGMITSRQFDNVAAYIYQYGEPGALEELGLLF